MAYYVDVLCQDIYFTYENMVIIIEYRQNFTRI